MGPLNFHCLLLLLLGFLAGCFSSGSGNIDELNTQLALDIEDQVVPLGSFFSYVIGGDDITGTRGSDRPAIAITSNGGSGITLGNAIFRSAVPLSVAGSYQIEGTIALGGEIVPWSFMVIVGPTEQLLLSIPVQEVVEGRDFAYQVSRAANILNLAEDKNLYDHHWRQR